MKEPKIISLPIAHEVWTLTSGTLVYLKDEADEYTKQRERQLEDEFEERLFEDREHQERE